jgi:transforming growth factor-beta-induced protein
MSNNVLKAAIAAGVIALGAAGVAQAKSPVPGKPGPLNIVEFAIAANSSGPTAGAFDTLLEAAQCDYFDSAVVNLLSGSDRYTLFAPTDDAFAKLGLTADNVCSTYEATPDALFNVLAYHVTEGRRFSNSVFNKRSPKMVEMLNEQYIVTLGGKDPTITDNQGRTIRPVAGLININASNGVIHVIDTVLLP